MRLVLQNVLWLLVFMAYQYICLENSGVHVGVFLDQETDQSEIPLNAVILKRNIYDRIIRFNSTTKRLSNSESGFDVSKILCDVISAGDGVGAIIDTSSEPISDTLHSICTNFQVPYISIAWRSTPFRDGTTLNLFPKADIFQEGLADIVKSLRWNSFVIIYESDETLIKLQEVLKLQVFSSETKRNSIMLKQLSPGKDHRTLLKEVKNSTENNIILDCRTENIIPILEQAKNLDLLNLHYNYFITSLDAHTLESDFDNLDATANITTIRLFDYNHENVLEAKHIWNQYSINDFPYSPNMIKTATLLFHDAFVLLTESINDLALSNNVGTNSINCSDTLVAPHGYNLVAYMQSKTFLRGASGPLKFDDNGNRIDFHIHVIDTLDKKIIATWHAESKTLDLKRSSSETDDAIVANLQKTTVIVSSRIGEPYLMYRQPEEGVELEGNDRYEGYSLDLIKEIARIVKFTFEFHLTADGQYGKYDEKQRKWTGLIGDLLEKRAHLAICDLTITHQRREVVDFSMPFMTLGIGILYRKAEKKDINMFAFLDPFSVPVWIYTATLYLVISVVLYFISRMTPGDWENPHPCDENPEELENIWDIKNCMWLTLGSIMTQGCDILPKGISSRLAVSMWWFFSLILTSSYTANLAAFLTKDRMEPTIDSAEALSKQTRIKYGAVDGGSTQAFFRDSNFSTYQRMWLSMQQARPSVFAKNNADGVLRVQTSKGNNYAFLMESTQIEYEEETKCDLKKVGGSLDTKSYGIAMPINSPYRSAINKAILKLQESGKLAELKTKWWKEKRKEPPCDKSDADEAADGAELALANIGGVFYVLGIGVGAAFVLAICEFLWNVRSVSVEEHMTFMEALKVELKFACNIWITKKRTKPVVAESSGSSQRSDKTDNALQSSAAYTNISKSS